MLIKEANKIIISLSQPDKMPGYAYGLPAWECKTGAKLVKVPGSVCSGCYAMKGNYTRFPEIKRAQYKRLAAIRHPLWVKAMTAKINSVAVSKHKFFRWHDAGDVQDLRHLAKIFEICRRTPSISHWMPTREAWTKKWIERAPSNLVIRFSGTMIDQPAVKSWPHTSTVTTTPGSRTCTAPDNAGQCGSCRACWNPEVKNIAYGKH
jgi:hypothetical protein